MLVKEAVEHLQRYKPNLHIALVIWQEDDVIERAKELEIKIGTGYH